MARVHIDVHGSTDVEVDMEELQQARRDGELYMLLDVYASDVETDIMLFVDGERWVWDA